MTKFIQRGTFSYKMTCFNMTQSSKRVSTYNKTSNRSFWKIPLSTYFTWNSVLELSFNRIVSLIHPPIRKLKALAHKFSISWEMCALDWLSSPNLHDYQLWPSLTGGIQPDNRYTQSDSRSEAGLKSGHLLISVPFCDKQSFISNKRTSLFDHLRRHRWHATRIRGQIWTQDVVIIWLHFSQQSQMHSFKDNFYGISARRDR